MIKMRLQLFLLFFLCMFGGPIYAQTSADTLFESSVSELLKLPPRTRSGTYIESASKQAESIFEAPVSATVITREEIQNAGCLSISEALRLLPGVLVREVSNGTYHITLRGFNDLPPGSDFYAKESTNALILIDYRPVFNYFSGGVFWETLPIDIIDIDRIELVRGPASALYGPNAVTGVIHFITRRMKKEGRINYGNLEMGNNNTARLSMATGYAWNSKAQFIVSGNMARRNRFTRDLYDISQQRYVNDSENLISWRTGDTLDYAESFPSLEKSLERYAVNAYFQYKPQNDVLFDLSVGYENSLTVKPFPDNFFTPHSTLSSETWYVNSRNQYKQGVFQLAYLRGTQEPGANVQGLQYDIDVLDLRAEYNFEWGSFQVKPGITYRDAVGDDRKYVVSDDSTVASGLLNGRKHINNIAASIQTDFTWRNFRVIGAFRFEHFSIPKDDYLSYQLGVNYNMVDKHLLRVVYSRANRGSSLLDVFASFRSAVELDDPSPGAATVGLGLGGRGTKLVVSNNVELGYRFRPNEKLFIDLELFWADAKNFQAGISEVNFDTAFYQGQARLFVIPTIRQTDLDVVAIQKGLNFSFNYTPVRNLQIRAYGSIQTTRVNNYSPYYTSPSLNETQNYLTQSDISDYRGAPRLHGGFYIHYGLGKYWQLNLNGYYFTDHRLNHFSDSSIGREINYAEIEGKLLLNLVTTFRPFKGLKLYGNMRNLLGMKTYEYYFTDRVGRTFTGGFTYEF